MGLGWAAAEMPARVTIGGVPIDPLDMAQSVARCAELVEMGGPRHAAGVNAAKIVEAHDHTDFAASLRRADLVNADGVSVVLASRLLGQPLPERVTGIDLIDPLLALAVGRRWPVYLLGAHGRTIERAAQVLQAKHPGLQIAGHRDGYIVGEEESAVRQVRASGARMAFIGVPSPMKEQLFEDFRSQWGDCLVVGVGGSFDVIAGDIDRAPVWMQRYGLEWLHRLAREPRRLWRRYLFGNSRFIWLVIRERLGRPSA